MARVRRGTYGSKRIEAKRGVQVGRKEKKRRYKEKKKKRNRRQ